MYYVGMINRGNGWHRTHIYCQDPNHRLLTDLVEVGKERGYKVIIVGCVPHF